MGKSTQPDVNHNHVDAFEVGRRGLLNLHAKSGPLPDPTRHSATYRKRFGAGIRCLTGELIRLSSTYAGKPRASCRDQ